MTNLEKIRNMSAGQLAVLASKNVFCMRCPIEKKCMTYKIRECSEAWLLWFKEESNDDK